MEGVGHIVAFLGTGFDVNQLVLFAKLLGLFPADLASVLCVALVAHDDAMDIGLGVFLNLSGATFTSPSQKLLISSKLSRLVMSYTRMMAWAPL